jgi:hypothetical protein
MKCSILIGAFLLASPAAHAGSLTSTFSEVLIQNLQPGQKYSLQEVANFPYNIKNIGGDDIQIKMEVIPPSPNVLRPGYEVIPDTGWITLEKNQFVVRSSETQTSDIIITIPRKDEYLGKRYQVNLWSRTLGLNGGLNITAGLESVLLITTDKEFSKVENYPGNPAPVNLNFEVKPRVITAKKVKLGGKVEVSKNSGTAWRVTNLNAKKCAFTVKGLSAKEAAIKQKEGYEDCPDPSFLSFDRERFSLSPRAARDVRIYLNIPDKQEYRNKKYLFVILTAAGEDTRSGGVYTKLLVETE